jgi:YbbR domain-containing protein
MRRWLLHNAGLKVVALVLAVLLWMVVVGEQKVEVLMDVPITFSVPPNLFLVNTPPDTLQVRLRGPKGLVSSLRSREIRPASLPGPLVEGENLVAVREDLIEVPRGIQVVDVAPRRIRVVLEPSMEREVEVAPRIEGAVPDGVSLRRLTATPARVRIVGPASELRRIMRVQTLPVSVSGQRASFVAHTQLEPIGHGIRVEGGEAVTVEVEIGAKRS